MENSLIVKGRTINNNVFRPSDWVERLAASCASFSDDRRLRYKHGLRPVLHYNEKHNIIKSRLIKRLFSFDVLNARYRV